MAAEIFLVILCSLFANVFCRLTLIEQHATTFIKTENGQVYNCVPFDKQPAFSHSFMKLEVPRNITEIQGRKNDGNFGLEGDGCPLGTVPILKGMDAVNDIPPPPHDSPKDHCHAVVRTRPNIAKKFMGTQALIALYKPKVHGSQWSSGRMKLSYGGDDSIEAGWMVNPEVFHDNEAHLYTRFSAKGNGCINTLCPGFVQVDTKVPLGFIPKTYSQVHGDQWTWNLAIEKHQDDGNWWLSITDAKIPIGYWPKSLFSSPLAAVASQIEWGGEINNPGISMPQPEMGSGNAAEYDTSVSAFFQRVTVTNDGLQKVQPDDTEKNADCLWYYDTVDEGYVDDYWGRLMYYGGTQR